MRGFTFLTSPKLSLGLKALVRNIFFSYTNNMRKICLTILLTAALLPVGYCKSLDRTLEDANLRAQNVGLFVPEVVNKKSTSSKIEKQQLYALAQYLFNMYLYDRQGQLLPGALSLQHIGVLDPFYQLSIALYPVTAEKWYYDDKNFSVIYDHFTQLARESGLSPFLMDTSRMEDYLSRFKNTKFFVIKDGLIPQRYPAYAKPQQFNFVSEITQEETRLLVPIWQKANQEAINKVVIFSEQEINVDHPLVRNPVKYTYRWVKDECEYSSYLIGKQLLAQGKNQPPLSQSRIYKIMAHDAESVLLKPADPAQSRFQLANGKQSSKWQYHTAILVLLPIGKQQYKPVILDNFLGGTEIMTLQKWTTLFADSTYFQVIPFQTDPEYDKAIATVSSRNGTSVVANGHTCTPHFVNE